MRWYAITYICLPLWCEVWFPISRCLLFAIPPIFVKCVRTVLERDAIIEGIRSLTGVFALHGEQRGEIIDLYGCEPYNVQVLGTGYNSSVFKTSSPHSQEEGELSLLYVA